MDSLLLEIRDCFAFTTNNRAVKLKNIDENNPAWVVRSGSRYGVAIPLDESIIFSERFATVRMHSSLMTIETKEVPVLLLTSENEMLRLEFSSLCAQFVDPGFDCQYRKELLDNPLEWWNRWKQLMGNSILSKKPYSIIAEMVVLYQLHKNGLDMSWTPTNRSTHDLMSNYIDYEVKSTLSRYDSIVSINGQFQLDNSNKELHIAFCRMEKSKGGISINSMIELLGALGFDEREVNNEVERLGYEIGSSSRNEQYKILEIRDYIVDETFPLITMNSFVGCKIPENILKITYDVDLISLEYVKLEVEL
jgi:hypothetical protein